MWRLVELSHILRGQAYNDCTRGRVKWATVAYFFVRYLTIVHLGYAYFRFISMDMVTQYF